MNRDDIKTLMLRSGFTYEKTVKCYPGARGEEDIYTRRPDYPYTFRISRVDTTSDNYGLYVGIGKQFEAINAIVAHNLDAAHAWNSNKPLPMWTGDALQRLLGYFASDTRSNEALREDDEVLITTILPTINQ